MTQSRDFWSRRKAAVQAETEAVAHAAEEQIIAAQQAELDDKSDAELLARFDLPDPDMLQPGSDVSGFMAKAIPERLRRRALRRLWRLNPVLANMDGLVDYGEDYTDASCVIENIQTAYQVGKGMLAHVEALATEAGEEEPYVAPEIAEPEEETDGIDKHTSDVVLMAESEEADEVEVEVEVERPPAPRRMKFEFEG